MSRLEKSLLWTVVALQLVITGLLGSMVWRNHATGADDEDEEPTSLEEISSDIGEARWEMRQNVERLQRMVDGLARTGVTVGTPGDDADPGAADATKSTPELLQREIELNEMHTRYDYDPIQREPVEKARAQVEALLRERGKETLDSISAWFGTTADTRGQTRLLTHVVDPLCDRTDCADAATAFALSVFENPAYVSGVRLVGARIAMKKEGNRERVMGRLIELLGDTSSEFQHRDQIAQFLREETDPRAVPVLIRLASDPDVDRQLRYFVLITMSAYDAPEVIDALKNVCQDEVHGELRSAALHSLNKILGKDILDYLGYLKQHVSAQDPLRTQIDNFEQFWTGGK